MNRRWNSIALGALRSSSGWDVRRSTTCTRARSLNFEITFPPSRASCSPASFSCVDTTSTKSLTNSAPGAVCTFNDFSDPLKVHKISSRVDVPSWLSAYTSVRGYQGVRPKSRTIYFRSTSRRSRCQPRRRLCGIADEEQPVKTCRRDSRDVCPRGGSRRRHPAFSTSPASCRSLALHFFSSTFFLLSFLFSHPVPCLSTVWLACAKQSRRSYPLVVTRVRRRFTLAAGLSQRIINSETSAVSPYPPGIPPRLRALSWRRDASTAIEAHGANATRAPCPRDNTRNSEAPRTSKKI